MSSRRFSTFGFDYSVCSDFVCSILDSVSKQFVSSIIISSFDGNRLGR